MIGLSPALGLAAALSCGAPASAGGGPDGSVLELSTQPVAVANSGLALGGGVPEGWELRLASGDLGIAPRDTPGGQGASLTYTAGTHAVLESAPAPASPGEAFALRLELDARGGDHPAQVGLAFVGPGGTLDYEPHRIVTESDGWTDLEIRGTAPVDTLSVRVRWVVKAERTPGGRFDAGPVALERVEARSRARDFPLPRILLVTIETFRHDHASVYGYDRETTPTLARLAAEGALFEDHHVQAPYTRPSLSSLVTSQYPVSLGIADNRPPLPPEATTAAELFAGQGYVTAAFLAQFVLGHRYGFSQGFHYFDSHPNGTLAATVHAGLYGWLEAHAEDNAFVWVHLFDPHGPYEPPDGYGGLYRDDRLWREDRRQLNLGSGQHHGPFVPRYIADPGKLARRHYVSSYDAELRYVDDQLGELVDWLEAKGLARDTLLVVTADHGESMTDHDRFFAHGSLYEHDLHVPLVIWAPGRVPPGTTVSQRTAHLDLLPTMLDYAGAASPGDLQGRSLRGLVEGDSQPLRPFTIATVGDGDRERVAVLGDGSLKVILDHRGVPEEAYDLATDPTELQDLLVARRDEADGIAEGYRAWIGGVLDLAPALQPEASELSEDEVRALRALGYVE